MQIRAETSWH